MNRAASLLLFLVALLLGPPATAQLPQPGRNAIRTELVAETDRVAAAGRVTLAIRMTPQPGWHGYWKNPGDAGTEMRVAWRLPEGAQVGAIRYPVPKQLLISGLMNYVYEGPYALLVDLTLPPGLAEGARLPVGATLDYLACTDRICVPERAAVSTELEVGRGGEGRRAEFDLYRQALPRPLVQEALFQTDAGRFRMLVPLPEGFDLGDAYFFPETGGALDYSAVQTMARLGDRLWIDVKAPRSAASLRKVTGVLRTSGNQGLSILALRGTVPAMPEPLVRPQPQAAGGGAGAILAALAGALIGGLLLNVMPCVFPILSLKALSLVRSGGDEAAARREALAYSAGAIITCLALGAILLLLRAGGETVGWAFQLQDPRVIILLLLLVTGIAFNLAGLFELPALGLGDCLARSGGSRGAFWTGALAGFVATPCTGPFMGAALGAALILPATAAFAVFAGLGLGLAFPFLLLGFVPSLRRRLPRPGPWMDRFRRVMAIPMFLTALGLAWVLGRQAGVDGMALGLAAALLLALALWWAGRRQGGGLPWLPLALAAAAVALPILIVPAIAAPAAAARSDSLGSEPFSEARLAALRAEGRAVFVYFTADWCLTCKVNEKAALDRREVVEAFAARKVAVLRGDWTRGDPEIGRFLERHGRSGVPFYLFYRPAGAPEVLPQLLSPGGLAALAR